MTEYRHPTSQSRGAIGEIYPQCAYIAPFFPPRCWFYVCISVIWRVAPREQQPFLKVAEIRTEGTLASYIRLSNGFLVKLSRQNHRELPSLLHIPTGRSYPFPEPLGEVRYSSSPLKQNHSYHLVSQTQLPSPYPTSKLYTPLSISSPYIW